MARKRRPNPETSRLQSDIDDSVASSAAVIDMVYEEYAEVEADLRAIDRIDAKLSAKDEQLPKEVRVRRRALQKRERELDRKISNYTRVMVKKMKSRVKDLKASPLATLRASDIRSVEKDIFKIERMAQRKGADVRVLVASALGGLITLEKGMAPRTPAATSTSKKQRDRAKTRFLLQESFNRWQQVRKHAKKHAIFFIPGSEVVHKDKGSGRVIDYDGRRATVRFEKGTPKKLSMDEILPSDVAWIDLQMHALNRRFKRGETIAKSDIARVLRKIRDVHNRTKPRMKLKSYSEAKRALEQIIGKIQTRLTKGDMEKETVESLLVELEMLQKRIPATAKSDWAKTDQRQWATDYNKVAKALRKLRRKRNPCVGLHFHGKDADELLKALESSSERQRKKPVKKNPGKKKVVKKKTTKKSSPKADPKAKAMFLEYCRKRSVFKKDLDKKSDSRSRRELKSAATALGKLTRYMKKLSPKDASHEEIIIGIETLCDVKSSLEQSRKELGITRREAKEIYEDVKDEIEKDADSNRSPKSNPKKKAAKKKATRKKAPQWQLLINRCRKLWDEYCDRPSKKRLKEVLDHLEKMKASTSKRVKEERSSCLRVANKEARRLKVK